MSQSSVTKVEHITTGVWNTLTFQKLLDFVMMLITLLMYKNAKSYKIISLVFS